AAKAEARTIRSIRLSQQADPTLAVHRAIDQSAMQAAAAGDCYRYHWRCILRGSDPALPRLQLRHAGIPRPPRNKRMR
ncbi:MAG: hypothetical protein E7A86_00915, partial [Bradyrhizobium sp.]|nr:hypothetical protein [Bradyrhizobium sp.]